MHTNHVFFMGPDDSPGCPSIDFSKRENSHHDWLSIAQMLDEPERIDARVFSKIDIKVVTQRPQFDCLSFNARLLVSDAAKAMLNLLVSKDCQFTPLRVNGRPFNLLLPITVRDVLDKTRTKLSYFPHDAHRVMQVTQYSFQKRIILDPSLFRIPESLIRVFVTDTVEEAIRKSGLIGFQFIDFEAPPRDIPVS